jgi:DNA invertase Pin-like site-specific DNA recombinase
MKNLPAFGYLRVSSDGQVDGDGFPRQRAAIERYAEQNGFEIVQWFEERGVSGTIADRPALQEMMVALMSNGVRTVFIEKLDRIARDLMVQETIIGDMRKRGFELVSTMEPDLCTDDPSRKLVRQIMGAIAEYDRTMLVLKMRAARQRVRASGKKCEGRKVYGTRPGEKENAKFIAELFHQGKNYSQIATEMNAQNRPTRTKGSKWSSSTVANIVRAQAATQATDEDL